MSTSSELTKPQSIGQWRHASSKVLTMLSTPEELKDGWASLRAEFDPANEQRFLEQHLK